MGVYQRIADKVNVAHLKQAEQLAAVGIVIAVHGLSLIHIYTLYTVFFMEILPFIR